MPYETFLDYWLAIIPIESSNYYMLLKCFTFSNWSKSDQKKFDKELVKKCSVNIEDDERKTMNTKEMAERLARTMNGI